jgi:hypothetical protein
MSPCYSNWTRLATAGLLISLIMPCPANGQDTTRRGGMVGAHDDPGAGVLVIRRNDGHSAEIMLRVGQPKVAPYAKVRLTLAPSTVRHGDTLRVSYNSNLELLEKLIPGGLGAFWEMDLGEAEGGVIDGVTLAAGSTRRAPIANVDGGARFVVPKGCSAPYQLQMRLKFFTSTTSVRFTLGDSGVADLTAGADSLVDSSRVVLTSARRELRWRDSSKALLVATLRTSAERPPLDFEFLFQRSGANDETFTVASSATSASIRVAYSALDTGFVLSSSDGPIAIIEPGEYIVRARFPRAGKTTLVSDTAHLVLHPPTMLKVYDPDEDRAGTRVEALTNLEELREGQTFRIAVLASPLRTPAPEQIYVSLKTARDNTTVKLKHADGGGDGNTAYDMRGDTEEAFGGINVLDFADHWMGKVLVRRKIDTLRVRYEDAEMKVPVFSSRYDADAARLLEILKDYKAMYDAALGHVLLSPTVAAEFRVKSDMLGRAVALHDPDRDVPGMIRVTTAQAYLGLIQQPLSTLGGGTERLRYLGPDVLKERMAGQTVPVANDAEERAVIDAIHEADQMAMRGIAGILGQVGQMPFDVVENLPAMLASPVYSGYTLLSGRQMDGQWASGQQRFFAGVDVALTFVPLSVSVLKVARPSLYERAMALLRAAPEVRLVVDESLKEAYRLELAERVANSEAKIARFEQTIARAEAELAAIPANRAAAEAAVEDLNGQLAHFADEAPATKRIASRNRQLKEIEDNFRARGRPATAAEKERMKDLMTKNTNDQALLERQADDLRDKASRAETRRDNIVADEAAAREQIDKKNQQIANARNDIAKWKKQTVGPVKSQAMRRTIARRLKLQGNRGEALAFEAVSRDGFIRHLEANRALPNAMQNWKEIGEILEVFGKSPEDLAAALDMEPADVKRLLTSTTVSDAAGLAEAQDVIAQWRKSGVPYSPSGSIGPDGLFWNPKTNHFRIVEVKSGGAELAAGQLTDAGVDRWIDLMKKPGNKLYSPGAAEALRVARANGTLERMVIRVDAAGTSVVESWLVDGAARRIPIK